MTESTDRPERDWFPEFIRPGGRVRFRDTVHIHMLGGFPEGTTGTVLRVFRLADDPRNCESAVAEVLIDGEPECLEEWDYILDVYPSDGPAEMVHDYLEPITA